MKKAIWWDAPIKKNNRWRHLNSDDKKNPNIEYQLVWGNIIWGVLLVETIVAPIYFFGFSIFEPIGKKPAIKGQTN